MKRLIRGTWTPFGIVLIPAVLLVPFHATLAAATTTEGREKVPKLELTTSPLSNKYCWGDAEVFVSQIKLQLEFKNSSTTPVILDKKSVFMVRHAAARTADAADKGNFEYDINLELFPWPDIPKPHFGRKPSRRFAVLQPGDTYITEDMVAVAVRRAGMREIAGTVPPGDHFLQVEVATWLHGDGLAEGRERWSKYGYLHSEQVLSHPMPFTVEEPSKLDRCD